MPSSTREAEAVFERFWAERKDRPYLYADVVFDDGSYRRYVEFDREGIATRFIGPDRKTDTYPELHQRTVVAFCPIRSFTEGQIHHWASFSERIKFADAHDKQILFAGITPPDFLIELMRSERWLNPGDSVWKRIIPFLDGPVELLNLDSIEQNSQGKTAGSPENYMREMRSDDSTPSKELPWLDVSQSFFIAVSAVPGDDIGVALDFRQSDPADPRVVACKWSDDGCEWKLAVSTFSEFVRQTGM